jgi:phospholipid/cholesterol/gamma-HCH transport system substrate-binding protein
MSRAPRLIAWGALATGVVAVVLIATGTQQTDHRVSLIMPNATNLIDGLYVRAVGQRVGQISQVRTVDGGHRALVQLDITSGKLWPLPPDTRFVIRFGGTIAFTARYIEIDRGTSTARPFNEGAIVPTANVTVPVEFNALFNTFDAPTRANLRATVDRSGAALTALRFALRRALGDAPPVVEQAQSLFAGLGANESALGTLVRSTNSVLAAANSADPGVSSLLSNADSTFRAVGGQAANLSVALEELPTTLTSARSTMARLDATLGAATRLTTRLSPGVRQLEAITPPLNQTLVTLTGIGPDAVSTLATARIKAPSVTALLQQLTSLAPQFESIGQQATTQLACIRPYAPEIAGFASTWNSFVSESDQQDTYARLYFGTYPYPNATPLTVPQAAKLTPNAFVDWGFPRAPGQNAGKPWFIPSCGITPAGVNPQKDPEAKPFDPLSQKLLSVSSAGAP